MIILIVLAHPDPKSFNHAIAHTARRFLEKSGHRVRFHDLYQEGFNPILPANEIAKTRTLPDPIAKHCQHLQEAEGLVIVHPNWWGQPPAILKGWVDRILRPDVAYHFLSGDGGEGIPEGLLKIRTALILNTGNTPGQRERKVFGDPLDNLWRECILKFCGVKKVRRRLYNVIVTSTQAQRAKWLHTVETLSAQCFGKGK